MPAATQPTPRPLTVWELTCQIQDLLEAAFTEVWVAGEISNFSRSPSGHCYLTLKDDRAQLRAVIWHGVATRLRYELHDGLKVICRGRIDLYPKRGSYQLVIADILPSGIGELELALRQLREKLAREGLFDPQRKRPLPPFVRHIAVITSPTGAAIRDFLQVLYRRWRGANVLVVPVRVQGEGAAAEIVAAIRTVNHLAVPLDCIVLTRGGGSMEDLWAFNEEPVVRAIVASRLPVVSAIGHEIDVTLSDLAADLRALTPTEAAELVAPDAQELAAEWRQAERRLTAAMLAKLEAARLKLESFARHVIFRRPYQRIFELQEALDEWHERAGRAISTTVQLAQRRLETLAGRLESLSPLAVLARGYSLTQHVEDGRIVRAAEELAPGRLIVTRYAKGRSLSRVEQIEP